MIRCPVCDRQATQRLLYISQVPVHCNLLWPERDSALRTPKGDIDLAYCLSCGHVANRVFDPALTEYTQAYENSLHFSPRFQDFARSLAFDLIERHDLRRKQVLEIGAGQGDFLRLLCELGDNRGTGFDEAYVPSLEGQDDRFNIVNEFAWQEHIERTPDMIYARHVLEHIEKPADFISVIRAAIGDKPDTLVYLEVPNMAYTLRELAIWDIIYEHCGYFTPHSLSCLLTRGGFEVLQTREVFGGQFLAIEAKPAQQHSDEGCAQQDELAGMAQQVEAFAEAFRRKVKGWRERLTTWQDAGKRIVAWGAGSKGVTFLNTLNTQEQIPYIVDINPRKLGKFVVGSGQEIVTPDFLGNYGPDIVIVMNPLYRGEIEATLKSQGIEAEVVLA